MIKSKLLTSVALLPLLGLAARSAVAENKAPFPFVMPWDDATPGTATDVSFLNAGPITEARRIVSRGGHFVEAGSGKRVKFLAVNLAADAAFPSHDDAEKVASRLAKLGINLVRLHHMDNHWTKGVNIWQFDSPDRQHFDPVQVDRLQYLTAQLKKHGIYYDVNLHVSREYTVADGMPVAIAGFDYGKRIDNFERQTIELQKKYAHDLLTAVNPYTGQSFAADPAVFTLEINNENSLVGAPWATYGQGLDNLPEPYNSELVGLWNSWLQKKYGSDSAVTTAWSKGATLPGPDILPATQVWTIEHQGTSAATLDQPDGRTLHAVISAVDGTNWHVQTSLPGINVVDGNTYTLSFEIKADKNRTIPVGIRLDQPDWHGLGMDSSAPATTEWKTVHLYANVKNSVANHARIAFTLGDQVGEVWIRNVTLKPGSESAGLQAGQSLARKNVPIPGTSVTTPQSYDWQNFLSDTETAYVAEMRGYLQKDLHAKSMIIDSQVAWGGLSGMRREAKSDFIDNHAYWQHPSFPHVAWDSRDWNIPNTSMVGDLASGRTGVLLDLASTRVAGKPFTVSEYNEPAPNEYQVETVPLAMTYAAAQDWDALFLFDYGSYGANARNDAIQGYFANGSNPAKMAFVPSGALMFRNGAALPYAKTSTLQLPKDIFPKFSNAIDVWRPVLADNPKAFLTERLSVAPDSAGPVRLLNGDTNPVGQVAAVSGDQKTPLYTSVSPGSVTLVGSPPVGVIHLGTVTLSDLVAANNFAALTMVALDSKSLAQSTHVLLTNMSSSENTGMVWNAAHTSVGDQWGHGPTQSQTIEGTVLINNPNLRSVYALDATGRRVRQLVAGRQANLGISFRVSSSDKAVWYELVP